MKLSVYCLEQAEQWDTIVRSFNHYDVYWLSGYVKAFYLHGDGVPLLFYYDNGDTRGINVVMKRDIADDYRFEGKLEKGKFYDFSTPYGYGGWIIEGVDINDLFKTYEAWLERNGIISEFVRFHPMIHNHIQCGNFYDVSQLGEVVHMDIVSPAIIWENIISKNRNVIRKAVKNDVKIYNGRFPDIYEKFRVVYNSTMDKDNADKYYYFDKDFYKSILLDLPRNAQVFWAEKNGIIIAASIMLSANGYMNYHLSGSLKEYSSLAPTNLLLYEAALWGCENGYRTLYLGGGVGSAQDSLFLFKRSFYRGELNHFYIGRKVFNQRVYDYLTELRSIKNTNFFPKYRGDNANE